MARRAGAALSRAPVLGAAAARRAGAEQREGSATLIGIKATA